MSREYCLPIKINLDTYLRFRYLLIFLYISPLLPVCLLLPLGYALSITVISAMFLLVELRNQWRYRHFKGIYINARDNWFAIGIDEALQEIELQNYLYLGPVIFLRCKKENKNFRAICIQTEQQIMQFHRIKVYLLNCDH